jgi:ferric-dicitrate binding protein FerR (iron transport regulator)
MMNIDDWTGTQISDEIIEQAAQWVALLDNDSNPRNLASSPSFNEWLSQDPLHQVAFAQMSEIWAKTACLKHVEHLIDSSCVIAFPSTQTNRQQDVITTPLLKEQRVEVAAPPWAYHFAIAMITLGISLSSLITA